MVGVLSGLGGQQRMPFQSKKGRMSLTLTYKRACCMDCMPGGCKRTERVCSIMQYLTAFGLPNHLSCEEHTQGQAARLVSCSGANFVSLYEAAGRALPYIELLEFQHFRGLGHSSPGLQLCRLRPEETIRKICIGL